MALSEVFDSWRTRMTAIRIVLCAFILCCVAGPETLEAHEANHTHPSLAAASLELLQDPAFFGPNESSWILKATIAEDDGNYLLNPVVCRHFYNPRTRGNGVLGSVCPALFTSAIPTARDRANLLWIFATTSYPAARSDAFDNLGRVLHLLQDMTSPAHIHDDGHAGIFTGCDYYGSVDDFERWGWCGSKSRGITGYVAPVTNSSDQVTGGTMTPAMNSLLTGFLGHAPVLPIDLSPGGFVHDLASRVYDFTTYSGVLQVDTSQQRTDLQEMFPSLSYDFTARGWSIADAGWFLGTCGGLQVDDWWGMKENCSRDSASRISGDFYLENSGGDSGNLTPAVWKKAGAHPTGANSLPLLRIYGDTLYPLATAYGAGLLKVYAEVVQKPAHFTDVREGAPATDWFAPYVRYTFLQGIIQGYADGTFRPNNTTTRAEALQMAYAGGGETISLTAPASGFADVRPGDWFYGLVVDAMAKGFVTGVPCGTQQCFNPNEAVSRAEAAKLVSVLLRVDVNNPGHVINSTPASFPDVRTSDWFYPYVYWLTSSKLENGFYDLGLYSGAALLHGYQDKTFHPERLVTRAEMAKLLANAMLYCRASTRTHECGPSSGGSRPAKLSAPPAAVTLGALYEQVADPTNRNAPAPFHLAGGDQQTVTGPFTLVGDTRDADGDNLFYFWSADGGSFTTSDPVSFSRVTWTPPIVAADTVFTINVVRGDGRGLVGTGTFELLVPGTAANSPGSGTITSPNGTQTGTVTVAATASDPDGLARVSVTFVSGGPELVLCGPDGPASCSGTSGTYSPTGVNPAAFGATAGVITLSLFVQDVPGDLRAVDAHSFTFSPPPAGPTFKLTVLKEGDGSGTVSGNGIVCGPTCHSTSVNLPQGSSVTVTGSAAAGSVFVGFGGDPCYGPDPCVFTLFSDRTLRAAFGLPDAFAVLLTTPANGDTGVATTAQVYLTFNRDIQAGPNMAGLVLREAGGTPVPFTSVVRSTDRRLFLIPSSNLAAGLTYVVQVPADAVTDTQGNPLTAPLSLSFTTAVPGTPKMYLAAQPVKVMEGDQTQVSIWFESPINQDRIITLTSTPAGELIHPGQVTLPAGEVLKEFQVITRNNQGSTTATTATLSAATAGIGQQSVAIEIENQTPIFGSSLKFQAAGVINETNHNGIFESGEIADVRIDVANFGSSTVNNVTLELAVLNAFNLRILGGTPFVCNLGSLAPGHNGNCTRSLLADPALPTGDYFLQVKGTSSGNSFLDVARLHVVNNAVPDFVLAAGSFPSGDLPPGATVELRYTATNLANGFSPSLPVFEVTMDLDGSQRLLYRTYANVRGDLSTDQSFRLPIVVPPSPGAHAIHARINPPGTGRLTESNYANNDAADVILHVAAPNQPPVLSPIPALSAKVGRALTFTVAATDANGDPITYLLGAGAPAGASIGPSTGIFTWTPQCGQGPASYGITVIAQDSKGATDTKTATVDVGLEADLGITQAFGSPLAVPGETVRWTLQVANHGPSCVTGVLVADAFPASLVNVQWTCSATAGSSCAAGQMGAIGDASVALAAGGTATYTVAAKVADTASGLLVNTATVAPPAAAIDPNGTDNSASATLTLRGLDFGDAPSATLGAVWAFPTRLAENGARHGIHPELRLGATIDAEPDGQPSLDASGDDTHGARDEDGVVLPVQLVPCQTARIQVTASAPGFLDAWIDFNTDGRWTDPGERIAASQALTAGASQLAIVVPCSATPGGTAFARFRFSSTGGLSPSGLALDGEVEDYAVLIAACVDASCRAIFSNGFESGDLSDWQKYP
ncbi:MAG: S-layer homology domain-containing protein [Acidobacteria bacterium]|nr:S-layer homology domain-containing protein [Acidobacteriota bacterium]